MSSTVVWDEMACSKIEIHGRIGGVYYLYLQVKKSKQHKHDANSACFCGLLLDPEDVSHIFLRNAI
jgi:hypothetical protein